MTREFIFEKGESTPIETNVKPGEQIPQTDIHKALSKASGGRLSQDEVAEMLRTGNPIVKDDGAEQSS